jgi:DNA-binding NarL/FixJ family response regulator
MVAGLAHERGGLVIRVLVADDNAVIRQGVRALLEAAGDDLEVVGDAATGREAVDRCGELQPDVVLLDIRMPVMDGVAAAGLLAHSTRVLMLTYSEDEPMVLAAIRAGAHGYLVHGRFAPEELAQAVRDVHAGRTVLSPAVAPVVFEALRREHSEPLGPLAVTGPDALTAREREVMSLVAQGLPNKLVARRLVISEKTVKNHIRAIYEKLGAGNRTEAAAIWLGAATAHGADRG